jgi:hypothetical protein
MGGSKKVTIGYKYYLGMHMVLCHGPIDQLRSMYVGERRIYEGAYITSSTRLEIKKKNLFGGKKKEGGVSGFLDIMFGEEDQEQNDYLKAKLGVSELGFNIPTFRGVTSVVLRRMYLSAMTPYIKPWAFLITRFASRDWLPSWKDISAGSANPAHMIRECLTDSSWGLGYSTTKIDNDSFSEVAEALFNESFGLSLILSGQTQIEDFIQDILAHISGVIYQDKATNAFKLKLIRDDYTVGTLPVFNETNILSLDNFERAQYAEMVNEVIIVYRPLGEREDRSVTVQNYASIQAQEGIISQTIEYPGLDRENIAYRVAQRELQQYSNPLASIRLTTNRDGWDLNPGDVFNLNWPDLGIDTVTFRVVSVNIGTQVKGSIIIDAVEDIFSLPTNTYLEEQESSWVDPTGQEAEDIPTEDRQPYEATYWDVQNNMIDGIIAETTIIDGLMYYRVKEPDYTVFNWDLYTTIAATPVDEDYTLIDTGDFTPTATLVNDLTLQDFPLSGDTQVITIENEDFVEGFYINDGSDDGYDDDDGLEGKYALIGNEIVLIVDIVWNTPIEVTIKRGWLDTIPEEHSAGTVIWFAEDKAGLDQNVYTTSTVVSSRPVIRTLTDVYDFTAVTADTFTIQGRQGLPYPPQYVKIGSDSSVTPSLPGTTPTFYPDTDLNDRNPIKVTWQDRNRLSQTIAPELQNTAFFTNSSSITPETTTSYVLTFYNEEGTQVAEKTVTGVQEYVWDTEETDTGAPIYINDEVRVVIKAKRVDADGTFFSYQEYDYTVTRPDAPENTVPPVIIEVSGGLLTTSEGTWINGPVDSYTYQWTRDGVDIPGETAASYTLQAIDLNADLVCVIRAQDDSINGWNKAPSNTIIPVPPVNTSLPIASNIGLNATCTIGIWDHFPTSYTYQWYDNGVLIPGEINSNYTMDPTDVDVTCRVTAINILGSTEAESNAINP